MPSNAERKQVMKYYNSTSMLIQRLIETCESSIGGRMATRFVANLETINEAFLSIGFNSERGDLSTFASMLNNEIAMNGLENLAAYIADNDLEKEIDEDALEQIKDDIHELISKIEEASIDVGFQKALIVNLISLRRDIQEYKLLGTANINHTLQKTVGNTVLYSLHVEQTTENIDMRDRILNKMRDFNTIFSFTSTLYQVAPAIAGAATQFHLSFTGG